MRRGTRIVPITRDEYYATRNHYYVDDTYYYNKKIRCENRCFLTTCFIGMVAFFCAL